jgi:hypothetical protein
VNRDKLAPLTGLIFIVLVVISIIVLGEPPEAKEGSGEIVDWYKDNQDAVYASTVLGGIALLALIVFMAHIRRVLADAAGGRSTAATLVLVGVTILATGVAIDMTIQFAITEAVDEGIAGDPVVALQALWDNDFMPMALGSALILVSAGYAGITTGGIPKWLAWIALILGILGFTPVGFVAFLGGAVWIILTSIVLSMGNGRPSTTTPTT